MGWGNFSTTEADEPMIDDNHTAMIGDGHG